jgi:hypothetical protein
LTIYIQEPQNIRNTTQRIFPATHRRPNYLKKVMSVYKAPNGANWEGYSNPKVDELSQRIFQAHRPSP